MYFAGNLESLNDKNKKECTHHFPTANNAEFILLLEHNFAHLFKWLT